MYWFLTSRAHYERGCKQRNENARAQFYVWNEMSARLKWSIFCAKWDFNNCLKNFWHSISGQGRTGCYGLQCNPSSFFSWSSSFSNRLNQGISSMIWNVCTTAGSGAKSADFISIFRCLTSVAFSTLGIITWSACMGRFKQRGKARKKRDLRNLFMNPLWCQNNRKI